ncbi:uncharacterized protein LOC122074285 [Macadamia integrifolia]|uniref:uncharacterized protein LOC122074285 n=1 Tax=Macadamia integrifolia TaxID=60698 RepID=UPI001C4F2FD3|nr:uncharacterized protein LOC122074285 [Macadamia integrifolia]
MTDSLLNEEVDAKTALLNASKLQERMWSEKAKIKWLKNGDRNSKFFLLSVKIRRSKNQISTLDFEDGSLVSDQQDLTTYMVDNYENFHSHVPVYPHHEMLDQIPKFISDDDNLFLDAIPTMEEVKQVVWDLDAESSPGPNGFLVLLKISASRLTSLLPKLISAKQGAFQKDKIISTNIGLASELANLMHSADSSDVGFNKNFYLVEWRSNGFLWGQARSETRGSHLSYSVYFDRRSPVQGSKEYGCGRKVESSLGPRGVVTPSHLLFADDIFIFINGSARYVKQLHEFLSKYQDYSGQKINLEKSKVFFGKIAPHRRQFITEYLGVAAATLPKKYLGVEIFKGRVKNCYHLPLLDKIKSKLAG